MRAVRARALAVGFLGAVVLATGPQAAAQATTDAPAGRPVAVVDLATDEGLRLVEGQWRYRDVGIVEVAHRHAETAGFDDSGWEVLPASRLQARKGNGRLSFNWYRTAVTIPTGSGRSIPPARR